MRRHTMHPYMKQSMHQMQGENHLDRYDEMPEDGERNLPAEEEDPGMLPETEDVRPNAEQGRPEGAKAPADAECRKELEDLRLRSAAEMENFKKRLTREHQEQMRYASEKVLNDILPALDNLDLALQYASQHEACKDMVEGVAMTRKLLLDAVSRNGLSPVGEVGEEFNPQYHEAIGFEANPEVGPGAVSKILQRGYKLNDRLLRPAKVMVNN